MNPDIVLVGAGPVGLFTAIEMKLHNPSLNIKILDRNKEYTRHHILRLEKESLEQSLAYKTYKSVRKLKGYVPTSDIETAFLKIAQDLGIEIETGVKIDDCQTLFTQYPSAHSIIGADGAHSIVRRQLFEDKKIIDTNLQYIVEIKYKAKGPTSNLPVITYGPALGQVGHFISENVGKEKDGFTPVSLFVFVDETTYKEIRKTPNAQFSELKPNTSQMKNLLNTIQPWLSLRKVALNEALVKDSEKINGVALSVYQSEYIAKEINNKNIYLVGDAAAAVPYFRALNAGLISATTLAKEIATNPNPDFNTLNSTLSELAQKEIHRAHQQNNKVNFGIGLNSFLANASYATTGALLRADYKEAMVQAQVTRPSFFSRNPRTLMALVLFLVTSIVLFAVAIKVLAMAIGPAIGLALAGSTLLVGSGALLFIAGRLLLKSIREYFYPVEPLPAFPWEIEEKEDEQFDVFNKLKISSSKDDLAASEQEVTHYPSPLKSNERSNSTEDSDPSITLNLTGPVYSNG
jgi:2-polyprenyl-6-methoxyphenol hydroxylase-like FAD-dependent oxidoreductase